MDRKRLIGLSALVLGSVVLWNCDKDDTVFGPQDVKQFSGSVSGRVQDQRGGVVPQALVTVYPGGVTTVSDDSGKFEIGNMAPGAYRFALSKADYRDTARQDSVRVGMLEDKQVDPLRLAYRFATVKGSVDLTGTGNQFPGVVVEDQDVSTTVLPTGKFTLGRIEPGHVRLFAACQGVGYGERELDLTAGDTVSSLSLSIDHRGGTVSGTVVDTAGRAIPGAQVTSAGGQLSTGTDLNGRFSLSNVPPTAMVRVASGGLATTLTGLVVPEGGLATVSTVQLGVVRPASRLPVPQDGIALGTISDASIYLVARDSAAADTSWHVRRWLWASGSWKDSTSTNILSVKPSEMGWAAGTTRTVQVRERVYRVFGGVVTDSVTGAATITVRIAPPPDRTPPVVRKASPSKDTAVAYTTSVLNVAWTVSDNKKLDSVWIDSVWAKVDSGKVSRLDSLSAGRNVIRVIARDSAGNVSWDSIVVTRAAAAKAADSTLASLAMQPGTLSPAFDRDSLVYRDTIGATDTAFAVFVDPADSASKVLLDGVQVPARRFDTVHVALSAASVQVKLEVVASDGDTLGYVVNVVRRAAGSASDTLALVPGSAIRASGTLRGVASGTHEYSFKYLDARTFAAGGTVTVAWSIGNGCSASFDLFAQGDTVRTSGGQNSRVQAYDAGPGSSGSFSYTFRNPQILALGAEGNLGSGVGASNTYAYAIDFAPALDTVTTLRSLVFDSAQVTPAFDSSKTSIVVTLPAGKTTLAGTAVASSSSAVIRFKTAVLPSGSPFHVDIASDSTFALVVSNPNTSRTTTYAVTVRRRAAIDSTFGIPWNNTIAYGSLTDARDGKVYRTVKIGNQNWMAQNLDFRKASNSTDTVGTCPGGGPDSCSKYGRTYSAKQAMAGSAYSILSPSGVQGVCPQGWHLPSPNEWLRVTSAAAQKVGKSLDSNLNYPGQQLKAARGWEGTKAGNGLDSLGFRALPAGDGGLGKLNVDMLRGVGAAWWSSADAKTAWSEQNLGDSATIELMMYSDSQRVSQFAHYGGNISASIRCVEDYALDASLAIKSLAFDSAQLTEAFVGTKTNYVASAPSGTKRLVVDWTTTSEWAFVKVNGTYSDTVDVGTDTTITLLVANQNTSATKTYTVRVVHQAATRTVALSGRVNAATGAPMAGVGVALAGTSLAATTAADGTWALSGTAPASSIGTDTLVYTYGGTAFLRDTLTNLTQSAIGRTYVAPASTDTSTALASLGFGGTLSPSFDADSLNYTRTRSRASSTLTIRTSSSVATVQLNGTPMALSSGSGSASISAADTITRIAVSNPNTTNVRTYTVRVVDTVAAPAFSPAAGSYSGAQTVTLSTATAGASIYYTLDGGVPTTSSPLYGAPIPVSATERVRAIAVKSGVSSAERSAAYVIATSDTSTALVKLVVDTVVGRLSPAFDSTKTSYNDTLAAGTGHFVLTPTASSSSDTVRVNGIVVKSGSRDSVALGADTATIRIAVKNPNTPTITTYTVSVVRKVAPPAFSSIHATSGVLVQQRPGYFTDTVPWGGATEVLSATGTGTMKYDGALSGTISLASLPKTVYVTAANGAQTVTDTILIMERQGVVVKSSVPSGTKFDRSHVVWLSADTSVDTTGLTFHTTLDSSRTDANSKALSSPYAIVRMNPTRIRTSPWRGGVQVGAEQTFDYPMDSCIYDFNQMDSAVAWNTDLAMKAKGQNFYQWFNESSSGSWSIASSTLSTGDAFHMDYSIDGVKWPTVGVQHALPWDPIAGFDKVDLRSLTRISFLLKDTRGTGTGGLRKIRVTLGVDSAVDPQYYQASLTASDYGWMVAASSGVATPVSLDVGSADYSQYLPSTIVEPTASIAEVLKKMSGIHIYEQCGATSGACTAQSGTLEIDDLVYHFK